MLQDGTPGDGRRYTEREVALVIKRAAELQSRAAEQGASESEGLSLAELEQVAREAGIDPALIREAAENLDTRHNADPPSPFLGAPSVISIERTIRGEVSADEYEAIVQELRRTFNDNGIVSTLGRSLAWSSTPQSYGRHASRQQIDVTVSVRNGNTVIHANQSLRGTAGALFGGIMGGVGGGTTGISMGIGFELFHSVAAAFAMWGVVIAGTYGLARTLFVNVSRKRGEQLRAAVDRIASHVAATAKVQSAIGGSDSDALGAGSGGTTAG